MIRPHEVSVVVQGPVVGRPGDAHRNQHTRRCLASIRRHLPEAEIVFSTYTGADLRGLDYDLVVESPDPGAVVQNDHLGTLNNINRQIVTTRAGILASSRPLVLKLRSDLELASPALLEHFGRFRARHPKWQLVEERLIASTRYARQPRGRHGYPLHPSDWLFFGKRDDVFCLWDLPLASEPETSRWFAHRPQPPEYSVWSNLCRYLPEQYLWTSFLRKFGPVTLDHAHDVRAETVELTELSFANNLVLLEPRQLGVRFLKYRLRWVDRLSLLSHAQWRELYRQYCDPTAARDWNLGDPWRQWTHEVYQTSRRRARRFFATVVGRRDVAVRAAFGPTATTNSEAIARQS